MSRTYAEATPAAHPLRGSPGISTDAPFELRLVVESPTGERRDVVVQNSGACSVAQLTAELCAFLDVDGDCDIFVARSKAWLSPETLVAETGLRTGDTVALLPHGLSRFSVPQTPAACGHAVLTVLGGPAIGTRAVLDRGDHVLGRDPSCDVVVEDAFLSRRHVKIHVDDSSVAIEDLGSSNGSFVEGRRIVGTRTLSRGEVLELGATLLTIGPSGGEAANEPHQEGAVVLFNRPPRVRPRGDERVFRIPAPPSKPERPKLPLAACLVPLAMGAVMWRLFPDNPAMLVFMALSPVMAVFSVIETFRSGRRRHKRLTREFRSNLVKVSAEIEAAVVEEARTRRERAPGAPELEERATLLSPRLWERRQGDDDYLELRAAWGDDASRVRVELEDGGADDLRKEALREAEKAHHVAAVPLVVRVTDAGVIGITGPREDVAGLGRWLTTQAATLHSPRDLAIVAAVSDGAIEQWEWLKWLPHCADPHPASFESSIACGARAALKFVASLQDLLNDRKAKAREAARSGRKPAFRSVLVLLDEAAVDDRGALTPLLAAGPAHDVFFLWLGSTTRYLPNECGALVEIDSANGETTVVWPDTGKTLRASGPETLSEERARRVALSLAPVRDVSETSAAGAVPRSVGLLELLDLRDPDADDIMERWRAADGELKAAIGARGGGPMVVDLRRDGPHGLVGGTTGAGKSELLQSLVASFAAAYPPTRLNFLLVDYKGGSAFKDCANLPHVVGMVTDLDGHLAERALVSLRAELVRREGILLDAGARDIVEMETLHPGEAPPNLILVIDEFAALIAELPEFVDGVIDIAQRGRSLGLHLLLATQRPAGVVNDNLRANTNLRITLRVNDESDSDNVIGVKDAAHIPRSIPGRALVRTGHGEVATFQAAYAGGSSSRDHAAPVVEIRPFHAGAPAQPWTSEPATDTPSDMAKLVTAIETAWTRSGAPPPPRPWLPSLPETLRLRTLEELARNGGRRISALGGLVDEPSLQRQRVWHFDLDSESSCLVYGTGSSGKTTLLRSIAVSLARRCSPRDVHVYGLDFGNRGLAPLERLPHCGSIVGGADTERVRRLFRKLRTMVDERRLLFARHGVSSLRELRSARPDEQLPHVLVLFDDYGGFLSTFERIDLGELVDAVPRLVADGASLGIHFVISADRRGAVPGALAGIVTRRVVFAMADESDYSALGFRGRTAEAKLGPPGRALLENGLEMQCPVVGETPAGESQMAEIARLADELHGVAPPGVAVPKIGVLSPDVSRSDLPAPSSALRAVAGIRDADLEPFEIDLTSGHFVVAGPYRSGRSTALETIVQSLTTAGRCQVHLLAPRRTFLARAGLWTTVSEGVEACDEFVEGLAADFDPRSAGAGEPLILVVDDAEELAESRTSPQLEQLVRRGRDGGLLVVAALEVQSFHRAFSGWVRELRKDKQGLLLQPDTEVDGELFGVRLPRNSGTPFPPGRGYAISRGVASLVQIAHQAQR